MQKGELRAFLAFRARLRVHLACALALLGLLGCEPKSGPAARVPEPASAPVAAPVEASRVAEFHPAFLWQLQIEAASVHVLGSVHVARPELYPLDERIESAFESSEALVLELSLDEQAQLAAAAGMMEAARLPPGVKLKDVVRATTWERLEATLKSRGGNLLGLRGFRPWFVALALTSQALEQEGFSADHGIDEHFRRRAAGRIPIVALETVEEQLGLFTGLSPETEELMLAQTLEELDQFGPQMNAAFEIWRKGDAAGLDTLLLTPMRQEYPALFARLFSERNRRMVNKLSELAKDGRRYFVIVGAGHLVGGDGIVDLFGARGIVAKQL